MVSYLATRMLQAIPVLFLTSVAMFIFVRLIPGDPALSIGYPHGGIPRFVWPIHPMPLPVIGIGRLVRDGGTAELWTPWRVQSGNSGGPVLVREHGRLRVGAVTHVQHDARRSRGKVTHIPAVVLRAYMGALETAGPLSAECDRRQEADT